MTIQTKTDSDWFALLTEVSMDQPLWVLFGKEGNTESESAFNHCQNYSNQYSNIAFIYMDVDDCISSANLSSVNQIPVHVLFIAGVEYKRIWDNSIFTTSFINEFQTKFENFSVLSSDNFYCFGKFTFNGSNLSITPGTFTVNESYPWSGLQSSITPGTFTVNESYPWSGLQSSITPGTFTVVTSDIFTWNGLQISLIPGDYTYINIIGPPGGGGGVIGGLLG